MAYVTVGIKVSQLWLSIKKSETKVVFVINNSDTSKRNGKESFITITIIEWETLTQGWGVGVGSLPIFGGSESGVCEKKAFKFPTPDSLKK